MSRGVTILKQGQTEAQEGWNRLRERICPNCNREARYGFNTGKYVREKLFGEKKRHCRCYYCDCEWLVG